jgi:hypothetical protein
MKRAIALGLNLGSLLLASGCVPPHRLQPWVQEGQAPAAPVEAGARPPATSVSR